MNPFEPKPVKLTNYNPEEFANRKLSQAKEKTQIANNRIGEYTKDYHEKSYSDAVKVPKTYGDVIKRPQSYGDIIKRPNEFNDAVRRPNTVVEEEPRFQRVIDANRSNGGFNGNRNN